MCEFSKGRHFNITVTMTIARMRHNALKHIDAQRDQSHSQSPTAVNKPNRAETAMVFL